MFIEFELDSLVEDRRPYALDNKILKAVFECCDPHLKCLGVIYNTKLNCFFILAKTKVT